MKIKFHLFFALLILLALSTLDSRLSTAFAQGTAFTYQGRLNNGGSPANGLYDFRFKLYTDPFGSFQVGSSYLTNAIPTTNGLFTTTVDFGAGIFTGKTNWLEVDVRTNGGGGYTILSPLQNLTPTPYAVFAESASNLSGTLSAAQLSGPVSSANLSGTYVNPVNLNNAGNNFNGGFHGNGGGLTNLNAWSLTGNSGTSPTNGNFLGTTDNQPVELRVNGQRVFRLEPDTNNFGAPNVIGGAPNNYVDPGVTGATIAGGGVLNYSATNGFEPGPGSNHVSAIWGTISGGRRNTVAADHSVIGGGHDNLIQALAYDSVIGGGSGNTISNSAEEAVIAGGQFNIAGGSAATVGGGFENSANSLESTVGGGVANTINVNASGAAISGGYGNYISGPYATIPGGYANTAAGHYSFAAGQNAQANHDGAFVWSDDSTSSSFPSAIQNEFAIRAAGGVRLVTSGAGMTLDGQPVATANALTTLNAANITSGTLADARLSGNVAFLNTSPTFAGDITMSGGAAYHNLSLSGGNSTGYLYGSYFGLGDGIHLGYNYYYDAGGAGHVINTGGGTSRLSADYGEIQLATGGVNSAPVVRLDISTTAVSVENASFSGSPSDRNVKQDFAPVSPLQILEKVLQLPVSEWSYKFETTKRHVGPMAQDFYATFNIGTDDKHIAPVDEGGVALAAIQGLNQKLEEKNSEVQNLKQQNDLLEKRLSELETTVKSLAEKK